MLPLDSPDWGQYTHAYGPASDLPDLLRRAPLDFRPGHVSDTTWFSLWSALCHQGDAYSASYAAVPHLVIAAAGRLGTDAVFDPLYLIACIELARLEGTAPSVPPQLASGYSSAVQEALALTQQAQLQQWPKEYREALDGCAAALRGDPGQARAIFDADIEDDYPPEDP